MSFKSYLVKPYDHSHENTFFRNLSTAFMKRLDQDDLLSVLIGNLSCNGHQIDAVFVSTGKIIVIDFKNYGGELTFSENNPWQINTGADFVFVKGGGGIRNPFQQVSAYRYSLIQFLGNKQNEILEPNHSNFNFGHINSMIIFHQKVTYDISQIPQNIQVYFAIADYKNCLDALMDRASNQLNLSNTEIERIVRCLDVQEDNLFDEKKEVDNVKENELSNASERLEMVRKLLSNINPQSETEKLLLYYQTIVNLERKKEPTIQGDFVFLVNWSSVHEAIAINIENNPDFHVQIQQNSQQRFPKNIFVGINVLISNQKVILLHAIIESSELLDPSKLEIPISDFSLHTRPLEERNYPDELIDELMVGINQQTTIKDKIDILRKYLGDTVELTSNISLALSAESPFTSQLLSELKKIGENKLVQNNLERFLFKKAFLLQTTGQIENKDLIQITSLNKSQKDAVRMAFSQPISVITGPPGTGKTQVVLNILANALVFNKKVLLASKNNQAIDNVKERISLMMEEPDFFLRFGSITQIKEKITPAIETFLRRTHNCLIKDNSVELKALQKRKYEIHNEIEGHNKTLELKKFLETELTLKQDNLRTLKDKFERWCVDNNAKELTASFQLIELEKILSQFSISRNAVQSRNYGIHRICFNLLSRGKLSLLLVNQAEELPSKMKDYIKTQGAFPKIEEQLNGDDIINAYNKIIVLLNEVANHLKQIENDTARITELEKIIQNDFKSLSDLEAMENQITTAILSLEKQNEELGIPLFNALIQQQLCKADQVQINRYKNYVPDNIPWKNDEVADFEFSTFEFLKTFHIAAITSLSVKSAFPLTNELFDIVVIDEASQCDITSAIPLILRAKQLVVIGDPMQLKHITKVQPYEEKFILKTLDINQNLDYVNQSLYDYCHDLSIESKSQSVLLNEHYRCHPDIIGYSNKSFYGPKMGQELDIKTSPKQFEILPNGIIWKNVKGMHHLMNNTNAAEIEKAVSLAIELTQQQPTLTIGITTPFADQAKAINNALPERYLKMIKADTVHRFQGEEKDIMILSLVVTSNSPTHKAGWINNMVPYLINVAVTRAKNTLYIVGNATYCKQMPATSPIGQLVRYVEVLDKVEM